MDDRALGQTPSPIGDLEGARPRRRARRIVGLYVVTGFGLGFTLLALAAGWSLFMDSPPGGSFPAMVIVSGYVGAGFCGILLSAVAGLHARDRRRAALGSGFGFLALAGVFTLTLTAGFALGHQGPTLIGFPGWAMLAALATCGLPATLVAASTRWLASSFDEQPSSGGGS